MIIVMSPGYERIKSGPLLERPNGMYKRVVDLGDSYCQYPCPRRRDPKPSVPVEARLNELAQGLVNGRNRNLGKHVGETRKSKTPNELADMEYQ